MKSVSQNIRTLLTTFNVSNATLAKSIGVDKSTITRWFNSDSEPRGETVKAIADYFEIPVSSLYDPHDTFYSFITEMKSIENQLERIEVSAGNGRINNEYENTSEYSTVKICGDSMYPSLHDGDLVRVHHVTEDITPSDFAIVKINGEECTCKHIEITSDGIWLRAENKEVFEDKFYTVQEVLTLPVTIIGKAISIVERKL